MGGSQKVNAKMLVKSRLYKRKSKVKMRKVMGQQTFIKPRPRILARCSIAKDVISCNVSDRAHRMSNKKSWKQAHIWSVLLRSEVGLGIPKNQGSKKRVVAFTRFYGGKISKMDKDNFVTGCKPVCDALVRLGWLIDDADDYANFIYHQEPMKPGKSWPTERSSRRKARLSIGIYELNES